MDPENIIPFKMFGLHRTGSNLMVALMKRNFIVQSLETGAEWKHGPVQLPDRTWNGRPARFVLCVRNPYAWAFSCYRYFRRANGADGTVAKQFQRDPSVSFEEFVLTPTYEFESPIHRWNEMNREWLHTLPPGRSVLVRQEDQLNDQRLVLKGIEQTLGLQRKAADLSPIGERIDVNASPVGPYDRDYYIDRQYMHEFSTALLKHINSLLDWSLMKRFSYDQEAWGLATRDIHGLQLSIRLCTSDAGDAREIAHDPYRFQEIKARGEPINSVVDVGAHIGAVSALAQQCWPECRIVAYEPCPENARMLRINARRATNVTVVQAAITGGATRTVSFAFLAPRAGAWCITSDRAVGAGWDSVPAVSVERAITDAGQIDVLKIGCPASVLEILQQAVAKGLLDRVRWICGRIAADQSAAISACLAQRFEMTFSSTTYGTFFLARRLS